MGFINARFKFGLKIGLKAKSTNYYYPCADQFNNVKPGFVASWSCLVKLEVMRIRPSYLDGLGRGAWYRV